MSDNVPTWKSPMEVEQDPETGRWTLAAQVSPCFLCGGDSQNHLTACEWKFHYGLMDCPKCQTRGLIDGAGSDKEHQCTNCQYKFVPGELE